MCNSNNDSNNDNGYDDNMGGRRDVGVRPASGLVVIMRPAWRIMQLIWGIR